MRYDFFLCASDRTIGRWLAVDEGNTVIVESAVAVCRRRTNERVSLVDGILFLALLRRRLVCSEPSINLVSTLYIY